MFANSNSSIGVLLEFFLKIGRAMNSLPDVSRSIIFFCLMVTCSLCAEEGNSELNDSSDSQHVSVEVLVEPAAEDDAIAARLKRILQATEWFEAVHIKVDDGIVFLNGTTSKTEYYE